MSEFYYDFSNITSIVSNFISIALTVLLIVAWWKLFEKAGEHGWAAIIPYYNSYVLFKISGKKKLYWAFLPVSIITIIAWIVFYVEIIIILWRSIMLVYGSYGGWSNYDSVLAAHSVGLLLCLIVCIAGGIARLVFRIIQSIGLVKNFGLSGGYAVGLIFLPHIFYSILAFSSSIQYTGGMSLYGYAFSGMPGSYAPQNGGCPPVYINPYSGQPQQTYGAQPNYGAPQYYGQPQQTYGAQPNYGAPQYCGNPYVQPGTQPRQGENPPENILKTNASEMENGENL
jgi:hypothetical protein